MLSYSGPRGMQLALFAMRCTSHLTSAINFRVLLAANHFVVCMGFFFKLFILLSLISFLLVQSSSLSRFFGVESLPFVVSSTCPTLLTPSNLLRVLSGIFCLLPAVSQIPSLWFHGNATNFHST